MTSPKSAIALRHVSFEDLGNLAPLFQAHGYAVMYCDIGVDPIDPPDPLAPDLLVVLGAPIGTYEECQYPFLKRELVFLGRRIAAIRPTLGICLGSQLIARVLGTRVDPMGCKKIGFSWIQLIVGQQCYLSSPAAERIILHWHGDISHPPHATTHLAYSDACTNQAFDHGSNILGLQFPLYISVHNFGHWLIGHPHELAAADLPVADLSAAALRYGTRSQSRCGNWPAAHNHAYRSATETAMQNELIPLLSSCS